MFQRLRVRPLAPVAQVHLEDGAVAPRALGPVQDAGLGLQGLLELLLRGGLRRRAPHREARARVAAAVDAEVAHVQLEHAALDEAEGLDAVQRAPVLVHDEVVDARACAGREEEPAAGRGHYCSCRPVCSGGCAPTRSTYRPRTAYPGTAFRAATSALCSTFSAVASVLQDASEIIFAAAKRSGAVARRVVRPASGWLALPYVQRQTAPRTVGARHIQGEARTADTACERTRRERARAPREPQLTPPHT